MCAVKRCHNCGEASAEAQRWFVGRLCNGCYLYRKRHGVDRPEGVRRRHVEKGTCENCQRAPVRYRKLCSACYAYCVKNGRQRPRRLYARRQSCKNCGIPRSAVRHLEKGRCPNCASYRRRTGKERPAEVHGARYGYCECGEVVKCVGVVLSGELYDLCEGCFGDEMSGQREAGLTEGSVLGPGWLQAI